MSELVARTGRHQQRYEAGYRLIAGCIPFRFRNMEENSGETSEKIVEVLMINSTSGPGLLFPKIPAKILVQNANEVLPGFPLMHHEYCILDIQ
ncbi:Nudix hydrolase 16, mitochondrial [Datura stramonium]|uniref:Nudix hydrolase 16, mitochondrial n=1 Tax=Datura stramonium TaxID=4076 RepID=A0ABS8USJ3_DATST|nr:Nudix hydrolase 16, mitochondrial [Datura stramonium]